MASEPDQPRSPRPSKERGAPVGGQPASPPRRPRGRPAKTPEGSAEFLQLRLPGALKKRIATAADARKMGMTEWVIEGIEQRLGK